MVAYWDQVLTLDQKSDGSLNQTRVIFSILVFFFSYYCFICNFSELHSCTETESQQNNDLTATAIRATTIFVLDIATYEINLDDYEIFT